MNKRLVSVVLALLASLVLFAGCAKEKPAGDVSLQKVLEKKTLVLGLDDAFPPMGFRNENNEIVGFDIDVAREVCKRLGIELVPQPIDWNAKEQRGVQAKRQQQRQRQSSGLFRVVGDAVHLALALVNVAIAAR